MKSKKTVFTKEIGKIKREFLTPYQNPEVIIRGLLDDMSEKKTLRMLNTFISCNKQLKTGEYLALDFGGSNVRIAIYEVKEQKAIEIKSIKFSLRGDDYDYTSDEYALSDVFEIIAEKAAEIVDLDKKYILGHTFSFATKANSKNSATVVALGKGFNLKNAIGTDVNLCLKEAFNKKGLNIEPTILLNDTVATLLAGFGENQTTKIGSIIGTGHNMCFVDNTGEIINMESGGFNDPCIPLTRFDESFLDKIPQERNCLMEALIGGKNSAKLVTEITDYLAYEKNLIKPLPEITPRMMSMVLEKDLETLDPLQNCALRASSEIIYQRAAHLVACEILAVINYLNIHKGKVNVVFDGSVYEKTPYFGECLTEVLAMTDTPEFQITHTLAKSGSILGAVIACATNAE